ncbi:hypothetical protein H1230_09195 [Paenibacillus sp. 19GGS1-52]|uniref:hypothetical protein n=1 Tax=Paenibacillus sp. 19GGS1-52 TaxID=2758563 RepID=UPI001EFBCC03|nr:hypothetical protein [Paenibacillus sp. 19GGS1-52]ULO08925.1 hypothetical protein H1230_09195 [Paenibacillus sp. 19GGS1-52]
MSINKVTVSNPSGKCKLKKKRLPWWYGLIALIGLIYFLYSVVWMMFFLTNTPMW